MPEHADFAVTTLQGLLGTLGRFLYGEVLVVARKYTCLFRIAAH